MQTLVKSIYFNFPYRIKVLSPGRLALVTTVNTSRAPRVNSVVRVRASLTNYVYLTLQFAFSSPQLVAVGILKLNSEGQKKIWVAHFQSLNSSHTKTRGDKRERSNVSPTDRFVKLTHLPFVAYSSTTSHWSPM